MPKLAALVDGHTEQSFLQITYPPDQIRIIRCLPNGDDVSLERVAEEIIDKLATLSGEYDRVLVLFDREDRAAPCADIAAQLTQLTSAAIGDRTMLFGIKDIEIENWILADETFVRSLGDGAYTYTREGHSAKPTLSAFFRESLSPQKKAAFLAGCAPTRIGAQSESFRVFAAQCADLDWWWLADDA